MPYKLRDAIEGLNDNQRIHFAADIKEAVGYLVQCWDALRRAEETLSAACNDQEVLVETDDIEVIAGDCTHWQDAHHMKTQDVVDGVGLDGYGAYRYTPVSLIKKKISLRRKLRRKREGK